MTWEPAAPSELHAECASQEVELAGPSGAPVRRTCPAQQHQLVLSEPLPTGDCQVCFSVACSSTCAAWVHLCAMSSLSLSLHLHLPCGCSAAVMRGRSGHAQVNPVKDLTAPSASC